MMIVFESVCGLCYGFVGEVDVTLSVGGGMKYRFIWFVLSIMLSWAMAEDCLAQDGEQTWLNASGMTVETRFVPPQGYERVKYDDPYTDYVRNLPMLPDGAPIHIYTGELKPIQTNHVGVLDIDVGNRDLQQCSDAAQRIRTDYLFQTEQYDKINYQFVNGMKFSWNQYKQGYRAVREGKKTVMKKIGKANHSLESFRNYQKSLFMYAGVSSVMKESPELTLADVRPGDAIAGTGHLIIILDVVENAQGKKKVLLAQSYIPAQQIEVLKNPMSESPWYDADLFESCPFVTPEWTYDCPFPKIYRLL